jgi:molybdopterin biosynthesis enzyme
VAAPPGQGEEVSLRAGQEEVSARAVQAARDNPAWRRAPPDRVASGRTEAAGKVCKDVRLDRAADRRV